MIWTREFWMGAAERAVKTAMQVFVALVVVQAGTGLVPEVGIGGLDWAHVGSVTALAVVLSLATSLGNARFTAGGQVPGPGTLVWPPLAEEDKWGPHLKEHLGDVYVGVEDPETGAWSDVQRVYKGSTGEHLHLGDDEPEGPVVFEPVPESEIEDIPEDQR